MSTHIVDPLRPDGGESQLPRIDLSHTGTAPESWHSPIASLPQFDMDRFGSSTRLVVVAPHPDDETLGAGGLIASFSERGGAVSVISLTDGEAAFARSDLAAVRHAELRRALSRLTLGSEISFERWRFPDGGLAARRDDVAARLRSTVRAGDLVIGPWLDDGHPDHDAVGAALLDIGGDATPECSIEVAWFPIWSWHWHDPGTSPITSRGERFDMSGPAWEAKRRALQAFTSQTTGADPVVPDHFLRRFDRPYEVLIRR